MSKDEEKLGSFKIGDVRRPQVRGGKPIEQGEGGSEPPAPSAGFPAIEERLENGTIESIAEELRASYEKLEAIAEGKNSKLKGGAKKAMAAYERTADLFEYLFATKSAIGK